MLYGQLVLSEVWADGTSLPTGTDTVKINLQKNVQLVFSQTPLDTLGYSYSLSKVGTTAHWQKIAYPIAQLDNLRGGDWAFQIGGNSPYNKAIVKIKIIKNLSLWEKWWFWPLVILYILAIIGAGFYLFFLYDFRQKLKMQHVRNQIAADLHDEVGSNLNSISIFTEVLRKNVDKKNIEILDKISANSKESVSLMQDTVWMINPKNDSTEKLLERMKSFASGILASKNISLEFTMPEEIKQLYFNMEQRKNCYLIFKEAINNIVKHAEATKVVVEIIKKKNEIEIKIEDNGKGFDINELHLGNGLQNFKERANEAEFEFKINSQIDKGTKIEMKIIC
jgi:two-component sensor histidine kinase